MHRLKQELLICYIKMLQTIKATRRTWELLKSSNLCTEIIEYTAPDEVAVCNLASLASAKICN